MELSITARFWKNKEKRYNTSFFRMFIVLLFCGSPVSA
jgi:hypothetical protein